MYLEGIGGNRNYTLAEHFFSNLTDPAFNTSYHLFGQGLLRFYGLGMERNISRGCDFIREASALTVGVPVFRSVFVGGVRSSYYNGLCFLKKRQFKSARDSFIQSAFAQFAPSIDMLLRMKEMGLGGKELLSVDSFFGSVLLTRLKEHFVSIPAVTQRTSYNCAGDPLCLRAARQRPRPPVHDAVRGSEHSLLGVPLYRPLREAPVEGGIPRFRALREGRRRAVPPVHGVAAVHLAEQRARNRRRDYDVGGKARIRTGRGESAQNARDVQDA